MSAVPGRAASAGLAPVPGLAPQNAQRGPSSADFAAVSADFPAVDAVERVEDVITDEGLFTM